MKKILSFILIAAMIITMTACGSKGETPEQAVKGALDAIKKADKAQASKYIDYDTLMQSGEENNDAESEEMVKLIFTNLSYNIISSSVNEDKATVKVEITNTDVSKVFEEFMPEMVTLAFSGLNEEQMNVKSMEIFKELIGREGNQTVTDTIDIALEKKDNTWKVNLDDDAIDAILGGMLSTATAMSDAFGGNTESNRLTEIDDWLVSDIWNEGFCNIHSYISNGTNSTGDTMDIDFTLKQLDSAMEEKVEYDAYISTLDDKEYSQIKTIWAKLSPEIDTLYSQLEENKPAAKDPNSVFNTGKFEQYRDAFSDAVYEIE